MLAASLHEMNVLRGPHATQLTSHGVAPSSAIASIFSASSSYLPNMARQPAGLVQHAHSCVDDAQADVSEALDKFADGQLSADNFLVAMQDMGVEVCICTDHQQLLRALRVVRS